MDVSCEDRCQRYERGLSGGISGEVSAHSGCTLPMHMGRVINSLIRFCLDSGNKHIIWFGNLLKNHCDGIISYASFRISNGKMEGINRKIDTIRRDGYGYPDDEYFFLKVIDLSRCPSSARKHDRLLKKTTGHIPTALYSQII